MAFRKYAFPAFVLACLLLVWLASDHVFFWDTVQLASKHAHWYFENEFRYLLLPDEIDSGHPPVFGMYLATLWMLFGKSLLVSHLAMLPFLLTLGWSALRLGDHYGRAEFSSGLLLLIMADPVMAGQAILVSPDLALAAFFLLGLTGIAEERNGLKLTAALGLALISTRGMMTVAALYLFELLAAPRGWLFHREYLSLPDAFRKALPYVPSGLAALAFLGYHYLEKGWIGYHADSPWAPGFERVGVAGLFRNVILLGWRLADFGRLFIWLAGLVLVIRSRGRFRRDQTVKELAGLILITVLALGITFLSYRHLQNHRYLLPLFLAVTLLFYRLLTLAPPAWRKGLYAVVFLGLLTGNLWIYPDRIAQGWDATLAHWPYYELRSEMITFLEEQPVPLDSVGTAFPEIGPLKYRDLSDREDGFRSKDLARDEYILYSNVMNDFRDEELEVLRRNWQPAHRLRLGGVTMILYRRPAPD